MKYPAFLGKAFVVQCPAVGFRCLATRLDYGPDADETETPIVTFGDEGDGRVRYLAALAPPVLDPETGVVTWHNNYGEWKARPIELADAAWAYPNHVPFAGQLALQRYANATAFIEEDDERRAPDPEDRELSVFPEEVFVVVSPPEMDRLWLASDFAYNRPVVSFSDGERDHQVEANHAPQYEVDEDIWHWGTSDGEWTARGLEMRDARWVAADVRFANYADFECYCRGRLGLASGI